MLTLSEALKTNRLEEFIAQAEATGMAPAPPVSPNPLYTYTPRG